GTTGLIYVDGLLDGSSTVPGIGAINTGTCMYARIGATDTGPGHCTSPIISPAEPHFQGLIDDVQVYNRALSADEIRATFNVYDTERKSVVNTNDVVDGNNGNGQDAVSFTTGKAGQAFSFDNFNKGISILKYNNL